MNWAQMLNRKAAIRRDVDALLAKEERTAEENSRLDELTLEAETLNAAIEREGRAREAMRNDPTAVGTGVAGEHITGVHNREEDRPWASFGEFLQAVAVAGSPGGTVDPRLFAGPSGSSVG